ARRRLIARVGCCRPPRPPTSRTAGHQVNPLHGLATLASPEIAFAATQNQQYTQLPSFVAGNYLDSRFTGTGYINGYTYTAACDATVSGAPITGALTPPSNFGVLAEPNTGLGRITYGIATDQVVRFEGVATGTTFPAGSFAVSPIGTTT